MAYQINKDTKILLVLFAVVVLCSAKLFKDYLYRNRYVEGMKVDSVSSTNQLRRPDITASGPLTVSMTFTITLNQDLSAGLAISWSGTPANSFSNSDVEMPSSKDNYTATVSSTYTIPISSSNPISTSITLGTPPTPIPRGTPIRITIRDIKIYKKQSGSNNYAGIDTITFTFTAGGVNVNQTVKILPYLAVSSSAASSTLTASSSATVQEIRDAITGINARLNVLRTDTGAGAIAETANLEKVRSAMILLLTSTYGTVQEAGQVFESGALYDAQKTAIEFIKNEKARAAANAEALSSDNLNKRRMAQINTYYMRNYEANTEVMKNVIYISIALIILAVLRKKELIPASISTLGVIFVLTMGGIVIGKQVFDIMRRNDFDFDKYDWNFNEAQMNNQKLIQQNSDPSSLSDMGIGGVPCYGASCCAIGTSWDQTTSRCVPSTRITGTAAWTTTSTPHTLIVRLTTTIALGNNDTVTIELPADGLFVRSTASTAPSATASSLQTLTPATLTDSNFVLTAGSSGLAAQDITITISGLTVNDATKSTSTKTITAYTSKETNRSGITITGIQ
jgi:hypothetical protein